MGRQVRFAEQCRLRLRLVRRRDGSRIGAKASRIKSGTGMTGFFGEGGGRGMWVALLRVATEMR
jgi:hypothetical protein